MADHKHAAAPLPSQNKKGSNSSYRDDPDAVSMHTTRSDYEYDDLPDLPSYSDSVAADQEAASNARNEPEDAYRSIPAPKQTNWNSFRCSQGNPSAAIGCETSIRMDANLMQEEKLYEYISKYLRYVSPRPYVRIEGWHWKTVKKDNKKSQERTSDFDIVMSLKKYLPNHGDEHQRWQGWVEDNVVGNSEKAYRGRFRKTRMKGYNQDIQVGDEGTPDLRDWCRDFCSSKSWLKVFRLERKITGFQEEIIKQHLETCIRNTHYRGHVDITFPIGDRNVDIYSPHWINSARITWVRWIFYLTFLWLITWPILYFSTKHWAVFSVNWKWSSTHQTSFEDEQQDLRTKKYASLSEKQWLEKHQNLITNLALENFHGEGTDLPTDVRVRSREEAMQTGNQNLDSALRFARGGMDIWNQVQGRGQDSGPGGMGWGGDERY